MRQKSGELFVVPIRERVLDVAALERT